MGRGVIMNSINDLSKILVEYIEKNKINYNIEYLETIEAIEELIREIKKDYEV